MPVLEASGRASLCASARAAWVPKPCPGSELGQSVAPLWRNAGFPLPSWDSLKVVLVRVVLEAPDRAAREGMVGPWSTVAEVFLLLPGPRGC